MINNIHNGMFVLFSRSVCIVTKSNETINYILQNVFIVKVYIVKIKKYYIFNQLKFLTFLVQVLMGVNMV